MDIRTYYGYDIALVFKPQLAGAVGSNVFSSYSVSIATFFTFFGYNVPLEWRLNSTGNSLAQRLIIMVITLENF